jgi:hypothetical protein
MRRREAVREGRRLIDRRRLAMLARRDRDSVNADWLALLDQVVVLSVSRRENVISRRTRPLFGWRWRAAISPTMTDKALYIDPAYLRRLIAAGKLPPIKRPKSK